MTHQHSFQIGKNVSLTPKRALFRQAPSEEYQGVVERQYQESTLASIRLEFDRVLQAGSMSGQQVNAIFQPRVDHIRNVFGDDAVMADNRDRIIAHLNELKAQVLGQLVQLGETTDASRGAIIQRNSARYQEFITFLQGRGVISQVPARVDTPPPGPALLQAYETTRDLASEFRNLAGSWTDVPQYFSEAIYARLFGPTQLANRDRREHLISILAAPEGFHQEVTFYFRVFNEYMNRTRSRHPGWQPAQYLESFFTAATARIGAPTEDSRLLIQISRELHREDAHRWVDEVLRGPEDRTSTPSPTPGPRPAGPERVPETRNIGLEFHDLSRSWAPDIAPYFSEAFYQAVYGRLGEAGSRSFITENLNNPQRFRERVAVLQRAFLDYARGLRRQRITPRDYQNFFNLVRFEISGETSTQDPELQRRLTQAGAAESQASWDRETEQNPNIPPSQELKNFLDRFERILETRQVPSREDLLQAQRIVRYVERDLLNGNRLSWRDITQSETAAGEVSLKGITFTTRRVFNPDDPTAFSKSVLVIRGNVVDFDLPRFLQTLSILKRTYAGSFPDENAPITLADVATEMERNPDRFRERMSRERYRELMQTFGFSEANRSYYEDFPRALSRLLDQQNPTEQKTGSQWLQQIRQIRLNPDMDEDAYRFVWMVRFYARMRQVNGSDQMNIGQLANQLLNSTNYHEPYVTPAPLLVTILEDAAESGLSDAETILRTTRNERLNREYREYLNRIPAVKAIHDFVDFCRTLRSDRTLNVDIDRDPWPSVAQKLNASELTFLTSPEGAVVMGGNGATRPQPYFHREVVQRYHELKMSNAVFRELVRYGEQYATTTDRIAFGPLPQLLNHVLTPGSAAAR